VRQKKPRRRQDEDTTGKPPTNRTLPEIVGPRLPPMIAWQRAGEPGWPFNRPEWLPSHTFFD
jgi:hypothetical protein